LLERGFVLRLLADGIQCAYTQSYQHTYQYDPYSVSHCPSLRACQGLRLPAGRIRCYLHQRQEPSIFSSPVCPEDEGQGKNG
jgi:hypothetical protein